jgi:hypothetical protein
MVSVERYMAFFKSDEYTYWEQTDPNSTFENLSCRKDSFQKLTIFSQGNNVLYAATSNRDSFLGEIHVSSMQLNSTTWNNMSLFPP